MAKQFVLTYSGKNTDIQDWIEDLKHNPSVNTTEMVCNAIRFYLKYKDTAFKKPSLEDLSFSLEEISRLKDLFIVTPSFPIASESIAFATKDNTSAKYEAQEDIINNNEIGILDIIDDEDEY